MACRTILKLLTLLFLVAVVGCAIGPFAALDLQIERPAAVILIVLGLPWVLAPLDIVVGQTIWPMVAVTAPIANLFMLRLVCRRNAA